MPDKSTSASSQPVSDGPAGERSRIYLTVEAYAGANIFGAITEMAALATHLRIDVHGWMNDVKVMAFPDCDAEDLGQQWEIAFTSTSKYKIACTHQRSPAASPDHLEDSPVAGESRKEER